MLRRIVFTLVLALLATSAYAQRPRVVTTGSDPLDVPCTVSDPPVILVYQTGSTVTHYFCDATKDPDAWTAVAAGTGTIGGTASTTDNAIVRTDGTGGVTVQGYSSNVPTISDAGLMTVPGGVTAALTGNASTATALSGDPTDCSAGNFAHAIDAAGNLTCGVDGSSLTGVDALTWQSLTTGQVLRSDADDTATGVVTLGGGVRLSPSASIPTCDATTLGSIERIEGAAIWPYSAVCSLDGAGGYIWLDITEAGSTGFAPVDFEPDFYLDTVDAVTEYTVEETTPTPWPLGVLSDGALYGSGLNTWVGAYDYGDLFKSTDGGVTWTKISDLTSVIGTGPGCSAFGTPPCAANMTNIVDVGDGEVIITTRFEAIKSSGWAGGSPTWSIVKEPTYVNTTDSDHRGTFLPWAIDSWSNYVILSEYLAGPTVAWDNSRYVYLSTDSGSTFSTIYDIEAVEPATKNHIHGTAIDPWVQIGGTPRLWISHHNSTGGGPAAANAMTRYSDDLGSTWTTANTFQPTTLRAAKYGMLLGVDYEPEGMQRILRRDDPADMEVEYIVEFDWHQNSSGFSRTAWRDPRNGLVYDAYGGINADSGSHVQVSDGRIGNAVYWQFPDDTGTNTITFWGAFVTWASGEDILVVSMEVDGVDKYVTMAAPQRGEFPDRVRNLGHLWPVLERAAPSSIAAGIASRATGTGSTAYGYRARAEGLYSTAIGADASVQEQDTIVIGRNAQTFNTGASNSVIIGNESQATFHSVVVGDDSDAQANHNIIIGPDITLTTPNNVVIGTGTVSPSASGTSTGGNVVVGNSATANHNGGRGTAIGTNSVSTLSSVAVGYGASAGTAYNVAIGDTATTATANQRAVVVGYGASTTASDATVVGQLANTTGAGAVVIGDDASATQVNCTVVGSNASCASSGSVALGQGVTADTASMVHIGDRNIRHQDSGGFDGIIAFPAESADRTWTLPDKSGTVAMTSDIGGGATILSAVKQADETVNNSDVLQDDDELTVSVAANTDYILTAMIAVDAFTTSDFKVAVTCPGSTASWFAYTGYRAGTPAINSDIAKECGTAFSIEATGGGNSWVTISGSLSTAGTAGSVTIQWAQATAQVEDTIVQNNSYLRLEEVP